MMVNSLFSGHIYTSRHNALSGHDLSSEFVTYNEHNTRSFRIGHALSTLRL